MQAFALYSNYSIPHLLYFKRYLNMQTLNILCNLSQCMQKKKILRDKFRLLCCLVMMPRVDLFQYHLDHGI